MKFDEFYDSFAEFYDEMTQFEKRLSSEKDFFSAIVNKYKPVSALDIGCGTGAHSIILAGLGLQTVGIDPSKGMIAAAQKHIKEKTNIQFINNTLEEYAGSAKEKFGSAFCMGNSISHITETGKLNYFLSSLNNILLPGAVFVFQILNYEKILNEKERIVNIREVGDKTYIRFYDFLADGIINFNILTIWGDKTGKNHNIISTSLRGYTLGELQDLLSTQNFKIIETIGDMKFNPFDPAGSNNLLVISKKI